jgi:hypothetical protein
VNGEGGLGGRSRTSGHGTRITRAAVSAIGDRIWTRRSDCSLRSAFGPLLRNVLVGSAAQSERTRAYAAWFAARCLRPLGYVEMNWYLVHDSNVCLAGRALAELAPLGRHKALHMQALVSGLGLRLRRPALFIQLS